jgi:hypothetical protein
MEHGQHAVDLIQFLTGPFCEVSPFPLPQLEQEGEPAAAALFRFKRTRHSLKIKISLLSCPPNEGRPITRIERKS